MKRSFLTAVICLSVLLTACAGEQGAAVTEDISETEPQTAEASTSAETEMSSGTETVFKTETETETETVTDVPTTESQTTEMQSTETTNPVTAAGTTTAAVTTAAETRFEGHKDYVYKTEITDDLLDPKSSSHKRTYAAELIMLHFSSAVVDHPDDPYKYEYIREIFDNNYVGTHYYVDRDGTVYRWLPEDRAAWHAGNGKFGKKKYKNMMNEYSISIEIAAMGSKEEMAKYIEPEEYDLLDPSLPGYTDEQYASLKSLIRDISNKWDIPLDRSHVIGHDEYASQKRDPGELFDWSRVLDSKTTSPE